ncbi:hypothetical protein [Demequina activiva]|uniref:Yip1 domain-containing protein n=1 Tax=Demequina activiva TaxID=1582364 RepID=A0A919Q3C9_9MICO|nr:hypothetical protein [Demequina activiva]GIG55522.1 hypothetical protein Dac01nite_22740 [Demequina activiva]
MSDDTQTSRPYGGNTRAAWLATATGIPIYVILSAVVWGPGVALYAAIADEPGATVDSAALAVIAAVGILIAVVGIAFVAHTVGRVVFARTNDQELGKAAVAFGAMAAVLAVVPVVLIAMGQDDPWAAAAASVVIILFPCALTSAATRALLPSVDRFAALRTAVIVLLVLAVIAVVVFTFYAFV